MIPLHREVRGQSAGSDIKPCPCSREDSVSYPRHLSRTGYRADYRTVPHHYATLPAIKLAMTFWNVTPQTPPLWDNGPHCHKALPQKRKKHTTTALSQEACRHENEPVLGNIKQNLILTEINSQSANHSPANKSINMLTLTMIQTLDLFHGLSLGMGAWEGLTVECNAGVATPRKTGWITIWILLAGSEINRSAGGKKHPWKFRKCPWN